MDNELLLAMSELLDTKLKEELRPIKDDIHLLKEDVHVLKEDVKVLKEDVSGLKVDVRVLQGEMSDVKSELRIMRDNIYYLNVKMDKMDTDIRFMNDRLGKVEIGLHQEKMFRENERLPRLNNIEACYISTYERYAKSAERMEAAFDDIDMLKKTVARHSAELQKLA